MSAINLNIGHSALLALAHPQKVRAPIKARTVKLPFQEGGVGSPHRKVMISVKSGHVDAGDVRDLVGVVEREKAVMGWLITLETATKPMRKEAADHGFYESPWGKHGKI